MKRFLFTFLLGAVAGAAGLWYVQNRVDTQSWKVAGQQLSDLSPESIREELAATSIIVREQARAASAALWNVTTNARTTATIKAKLLTEPGLPGMRINVDSAGGLVTLSGTVDRHDQIARAVQLALETDGVAKVVSTIQVHEDKPPTANPAAPASPPPSPATPQP